MRFNQTGRVAKDFYALGYPSTPVYLLDGPTPVLFDAGYTGLNRRYIRDIQAVLGDRSPAYLCLTHSHFDHIGSAACFKNVWPDLTICAAGRVGEILKRPHAVDLMKHLSGATASLLRAWGIEHVVDDPFEPFSLTMPLTAGQSLEPNGNLEIQVLAAPGHTWDFLAYWLPKQKILVASEAVGCDDGTGRILTEFLVDYDAYRASIERLAELGSDILCPGHRLVVTGPDAAGYFSRSLNQSADYVAMLEDFLTAEHGDVDRATQRVKSVEYDPLPTPKQPEQAYLINTRARVQCILSRMERAADPAPSKQARLV